MGGTKKLIEKKPWKKRGSKVKDGAYKDCAIEMIGDKAVIVSKETYKVIELTSEYIESYQFLKEKERIVNFKQHTYYYYFINFKDGERSYVRMRRKYRDAMKMYTNM